MKKDKLLIFGASGHGKVSADVALKMSNWNQIEFLDDNENIKSVMGIDIIGRFKDVDKYLDEYDMFVAVGNNTTRGKVLTNIISKGASIATLVHPNSILGSNVVINSGTVIMAGVIINSCSSIGKGCVVNTGATIDHDNIIEDYVHISPGVHLAGTVHICEGTWIGIGGIVSNNIKICGGSLSQPIIIGAGATVVRDIDMLGTYVGIPARRI